MLESTKTSGMLVEKLFRQLSALPVLLSQQLLEVERHAPRHLLVPM